MITFVPSEVDLLVNTPHGEGYVFYIDSKSNGNDIFTVILKRDGRILHYDILQLRASINHTKEINLENQKPKFPND